MSRTKDRKVIALAPIEIDADPEMRPLEFGLISRLFTYTRPYKNSRNALIATVILRALQLPILTWGIGRIINTTIYNGDVIQLIQDVSLFGLMALFTEITFHYRMKLALTLGELVVHDLRTEIFEHLHRMPMSFFDKTKLGKNIARATSDVEAIRTGVQDVFFISMIQFGQLAVSALFMLYYDWALFLIVVLLAPIIWGINKYFRVRISKSTRRSMETWSMITATLSESIRGIRVTQGFVRQGTNAEVFRGLVAHHANNNYGVARSTAVMFPLLEFNQMFFTAALVLVGGYRVLSTDFHLPVGNLIQFIFLSQLFFGPIRVLGEQYHQALTAMAGAERVFALLDTKPDWEDKPEAVGITSCSGHVEFKNVSLAYDGKTPVLNDINFTALPGQTIALVGHTGSGKTSIINLVSKFYLPTSGEVLIDGRNILEITSRSLHQKMGMINQTNFLFTGTVMNNIRVGKPEAKDEEVEAAARALDTFDALSFA